MKLQYAPRRVSTSAAIIHKTHRHMQNRILSFVLLFLTITVANGQEKKWELSANIAFGYGECGRYFDGWVHTSNELFSWKVGLELTRHFNDLISLRTGIDLIGDDDDFDEYVWEGNRIHSHNINNEDEAHFMFIHVPVVLQYTVGRWRENRHRLILGIGPSLNFTVKNNTYDYNADYIGGPTKGGNTYYAQRMSALNGEKKLKTFNIGIQPSFAYHYRHCRFALEANIGLLDLNKKQKVETGHRRIFHIWPTFSYYF